MNEDNRQITVGGQFGDKDVTKKEFAKQWVDHARQFINLAETMEHVKQVGEIKETVNTMAKEVFEVMYERQNKKTLGELEAESSEGFRNE